MAELEREVKIVSSNPIRCFADVLPSELTCPWLASRTTSGEDSLEAKSSMTPGTNPIPSDSTIPASELQRLWEFIHRSLAKKSRAILSKPIPKHQSKPTRLPFLWATGHSR